MMRIENESYRQQQGRSIQGSIVHMNAERECSVDEGVRGHQCVTRIYCKMRVKAAAGTKCAGSNCTGDLVRDAALMKGCGVTTV